MKKDKYPRAVRYYESFTDDFEASNKAPIDFHKSYVYIKRSFGHRFLSFICHNVIAPPIAFFYSRVILRERIIGKRKLRIRGGKILYLNHTEPVGDAFCPHTYVFPQMTYTVVSPDNFALPVLGKIIGYLGAIPTPTDIKSSRAFSECLRTRLESGAAIAVFPEAHVWHYYTGIRPMDKGAFALPDKFSVPAFSVTRVYKKSRLFGYRRLIYVDGPFYADKSLSRADALEALKREITDAMCLRAEQSNVEIIKYVRKD